MTDSRFPVTKHPGHSDQGSHGNKHAKDRGSGSGKGDLTGHLLNNTALGVAGVGVGLAGLAAGSKGVKSVNRKVSGAIDAKANKIASDVDRRVQVTADKIIRDVKSEVADTISSTRIKVKPGIKGGLGLNITATTNGVNGAKPARPPLAGTRLATHRERRATRRVRRVIRPRIGIATATIKESTMSELELLRDLLRSTDAPLRPSASGRSAEGVPVAKHPGHGDQSVHGKKGSGSGDKKGGSHIGATAGLAVGAGTLATAATLGGTKGGRAMMRQSMPKTSAAAYRAVGETKAAAGKGVAAGKKAGAAVAGKAKAATNRAAEAAYDAAGGADKVAGKVKSAGKTVGQSAKTKGTAAYGSAKRGVGQATSQAKIVGGKVAGKAKGVAGQAKGRASQASTRAMYGNPQTGTGKVGRAVGKVKKPKASYRAFKSAELLLIASESGRPTLRIPTAKSYSPTKPLSSLLSTLKSMDESGSAIGHWSIAKSDAPSRFVLGPVYSPFEKDLQDQWARPETIEKQAWDFLRGTRDIGLLHQDGTEGAADVVESYIYRGPDLEIGDQVITSGTWMLGAIFPEGPAWEAIERGHFTGWSEQGTTKLRYGADPDKEAAG